jgi:oligopeptide/dipeptide ABC transporter ATP-binding protein
MDMLCDAIFRIKTTHAFKPEAIMIETFEAMKHSNHIKGPTGSEILSVVGLKKYFPVTRGMVFSRNAGWVKAVDDVTFSVLNGESFGIVGESGCGKTTIGRTIIRLTEPSGGQIELNGRDVTELGRSGLTRLRVCIQIIFQDPYASLNPSMTVGHAIIEPLVVHGLMDKGEAFARSLALLNEVGLDESHYYRYPHEFSGGQRQRIGIARALAVKPDLIIADEPVSALDVSIQAQILKLLKALQGKYGISFIFISHNLAVVKLFCDRIAVMYLGRIVEMAFTKRLFSNPRHPYTIALLEAIPISNPDLRRRKKILSGEVPSPLNPPSGCHFHPRCPLAGKQCSRIMPELKEIEAGHMVACHFGERL